MPKIPVNDINMYYEEYGQGEPIVFIGGFSADHTVWRSVVNLFAKNYRVIIFDNRGAGQTDCPDMPYTVDMFAADTVSLCKQLGIAKTHFVGNSMGGCIVQTLAYRHPNLIKSAVISNSLAKINVRAKIEMENRLPLFNLPIERRHTASMLLPWLYSLDFLSEKHAVATLTEIMAANPYPISEHGYRNQLHAILQFDSRSWVSQITHPALIIYSDDDLIVDLEGSQFLVNAVPHAESYCFKRVGHLPHIEQPNKFYKLLNDFLIKH